MEKNMNRTDKWIEARLMNAKKRSASDKVTSWARPRKKYFFLRVLTVTHGHIGQTFNALLSGISSSDMIVPIRAQKVFLFALLQMSPDET
jgi:hypothetical protein